MTIEWQSPQAKVWNDIAERFVTAAANSPLDEAIGHSADACKYYDMAQLAEREFLNSTASEY